MQRIYALANYKIPKNFIETGYEEYEYKKCFQIIKKIDKGYHERLYSNKSYKLFGDLDGYLNPIDQFMDIFINFMEKIYHVIITKDDFMYTENKSKQGSYHFVIPKYYASCKKLKEIMTNFNLEVKEKIVDTTVYSDHWFRLPFQSKEGNPQTIHIIVKGPVKDFVVEYLGNSECIDKYECLMILQKIICTPNIIPDYSSEKIKFLKFIEEPLLINIFDNCLYHKKRQEYDHWISIGMALKNRYEDQGFNLFEYHSNKHTYPDSKEELKKKYNTFSTNVKNPITIKTIYYYAKEDDEKTFLKIKEMHSPFNLTPIKVAKYIKALKPNHFVWKNKQLYCFNDKYWEKGDLLLRVYISGEFLKFLQQIYIIYFLQTDNDTFENLSKLETQSFKSDVVKATEELFTNNEIEFDVKYNLLGFNDKVYDLEKGSFRDYKPDDFISITTGYSWKEPELKQIKKMKNLIKTIFPDKKIKQLFLEILSTGLEGRCLEKFLVFNGAGRNGKGLIDDLFLKALGNYGFIGNNAILFEKNKTGANPEKEGMDKKRFIVFREPSSHNKIKNSIIKKLTGGGTFSAQNLHESNCKKKLHGTIILECNKRPLFEEDPQHADLERLIDIHFQVMFTDQPEDVNHDQNIFLANRKYKDEKFQEKYKYVLLSILFESYKNYQNRNFKFDIPVCVKERSKNYLEMSCSIMGWINDRYQKTLDKNDIIKLKDMYNSFKDSEYYFNLSKALKRQYNYQYFIKQISENIFFSRYYIEKKSDISNFLTNYKEKVEILE